MKITIVGRQLNVYDDTKALINQKLAKFDKFFNEEAQATVTLSHKRGTATMEVTIKAANTIFRSEVDEENFKTALDRTIDNIERQIRKNKTRLQKRLREGAFAPEEAPAPAHEDIDEGEFTIRVKKFEFTPMSVEEAIMQMNLLGHEFFVFRDDRDEEICVVYKRHDSTYGLICEEK